MKKGKLIVVSGSSGVGKGTVLKEVFAHRSDIFFSVSFTTRECRPGETEGVSYHYISQAEFLDRIERGEFLEWVEYAGAFYGTSMTVISEQLEQGRDVLLEIEVQGAAKVRARMPEAVSLFIAPPSFEELSRRLHGRGTDPEEKIRRRLAIAREEIKEAITYDNIVVNDSVQHAAAEIDAILTAESCRAGRRAHIIEEIQGE